MGNLIASKYQRWRAFLMTAGALLLAIAAALGSGRTALAASHVITSSGPLTKIYISDTLNCQVAHTGDSAFEFYPPSSQLGDCGTFLVVGTTLYGFATGFASGGASPRTAFTAVSQSAVLGSGTAADPYRIVTVVAAGTTGVTLTETDSYVVGQEVYRTDMELANAGATNLPILLYRAGDCFLQSSDFGFGRVGPAGAIACTVDTTATSRIEQWVPITSGSHYYETFYGTGWARIGSKTAFPDTCDCATREDNWAGLSWAVTVPAGLTATISHLTVFSPLGTVPLTTAKTADSATAAGGAADGYTITVSNSNIAAVTLNSIFDDLPAGFTYTAGSTTGVTTSDPTTAGQHLTWSGPFTVPGSGSVSLHFGVTVSAVPGDYFNNAGGDAGSVAVAPTGPTAKITVTSTVDPPIAATGTAVTATEGAPFSGTVATFTDPDASSTASEYSATISWGDGSSSAGTVSGASGGPFTVTGSHTYAEEGTYSTSVVIQDVDNPANSATASGSASVGDAALTAGPAAVINGTEGSTASGTVGSFSDANPGATAADFTATIAWGDGSSSAGVVSGPTGGPFTVSGSHLYAEEGSYTIAVTVTDAGGSTVVLSGSATIADAALTAGPAAVISGTEGSTVSGTVGSFSDANSGATAADFTATIAWGDGSSSAGVVSGPTGGPFTVSGSHLYAEEGSYIIAVTVTDAGGSTVVLSGSATIADAALTAGPAAVISGTEGSTVSGTVGSFSDANSGATAADFTATIQWGDGSSSAGVVSGPTGGPFTVSGSHLYAEEGSYTIAVTVTDAGGSTVALSGSATIADAALASQCAMPTNTSQVFAGATATFTDQSSTGNAADFSASIDWGDGTSSAGVITGGPGNLPYTVSGSHTYASTGFFTVTTTITDVGGSSTTATCSSVLVFGFASGGSFVIGDRESAAGTNVTFWGAQWWRDNPTSTGSTVPSFKGFAESPFSPACGVQWATDPGNSTPPPAGPLPDHMAVIVTSHYAKSGSAISGDTVHIVIVKTNPGYEPNPGHAGTGTVEAQVC